MIISHKYKFIFIKTKKTAGTSIETYLSSRCAEEDIFTTIAPAEAGHQARNYHGRFNLVGDIYQSISGRQWINSLKAVDNYFSSTKFYNHIPAYMVRNRISKRIWNSYFKFTVERDPFEKFASLYFMRKKGGYVSNVREFIRRGKFPLNYPIYMDAKNKNIIVDKIIRYEDLNNGLTEVFDQLGVPFDGRLSTEAKKNHTKSDYGQFIADNKLVPFVENIFRKEIELFQYRFENNLKD